MGNGGASGSIAGDVTDNGILIFDRSDSITFGGGISGSGGVVQAGSGVTILTGDSSYTGGTAVNAGTLAVGDAAHPAATLSGGGPVTVAGGAIFGGYGSVAGSVSNNGTLAVADAVSAFNGQGRFTIGGTLTNAGTVALGGAGVGNQLVVGSYAGQNGRIAMNTVLGTDNSPQRPAHPQWRHGQRAFRYHRHQSGRAGRGDDRQRHPAGVGAGGRHDRQRCFHPGATGLSPAPTTIRCSAARGIIARQTPGICAAS